MSLTSTSVSSTTHSREYLRTIITQKCASFPLLIEEKYFDLMMEKFGHGKSSDANVFKARKFASPFYHPNVSDHPNLESYLIATGDNEDDGVPRKPYLPCINEVFPFLSVNKEGDTPLLSVYGTHTCLGDEKEPNWACIAVHDKDKESVYFLFSGQAFSNFNESVVASDFKALKVTEKNPQTISTQTDDSAADANEPCLLEIQNNCSERGFHIAKAILNNDPVALANVLAAQKPGAAKVATNFKNMPNLNKEAWNETTSKEIMLYLSLLKLQSFEFYQLVKDCIEFSTKVLRVPFENIHIIENTDDNTWGNGNKVDPAPENTAGQKEDSCNLKFDASLYSCQAVKFMYNQKLQQVEEEAAALKKDKGDIVVVLDSDNKYTYSWPGKNLMADVLRDVMAAIWDPETKEVVSHDKVCEHLTYMPPFFTVELDKHNKQDAMEDDENAGNTPPSPFALKRTLSQVDENIESETTDAATKKEKLAMEADKDMKDPENTPEKMSDTNVESDIGAETPEPEDKA